MSLIKSISGIRGTIGGKAGEGLNPLDIVKFTAAYATFIRKNSPVKTNKIVVGRDARISGEMVKHTVIGTLMGMGFDVVNIGLATTPTTEIAVTMEKACGGIILTASHNPKQWNALKLLNEKGEFLNATEGQEVLNIAAAEAFDFADVDHLGQLYENNTAIVGAQDVTCGMKYLVLPTNCDSSQKDAAWSFIKWACGEEGQKILAKASIFVPANKAAYSDFEKDSTKNLWAATNAAAHGDIPDWAYFENGEWVTARSTSFNGDLHKGAISIKTFMDNKGADAESACNNTSIVIRGRDKRWNA